MRRNTAFLAILIGATIVTAPVCARTTSRAALSEVAEIKGLIAPGEIVVDRWGIAHIYGANTHDAFFLQGYNAARDRLWQIDLWRKRGLGRLSASFGPQFAEQDRASRLLLYRGDMRAEWASYPSDAKAWIEAFVGGINAYVAETRTGQRGVPVEFDLTRSLPETWSPEDVMRIRSHALIGNLASEVIRAQSLCNGGLKYEPLRQKLEPAHVIQPPQGLDLCSVGPDVLKDYVLGTSKVSFDGQRMRAEVLDLPTLARIERDERQEGSNNWVVAASHSATGRPMLANDPHRAHSVPSLRYLVDVSAPDLHVIGAGEPALPGVSFGHNGTAAWGLTIFYIDQEDLFVYETSASHPGAYRYQGSWEQMKVIHEKLEVKGEPDRDITLAFTRHGPLLSQDTARGTAFALRTIWTEPGAGAYLGSTWMFQAKSWSDFELAHAHWGGPPLNLLYADINGDIGWRPSGIAPVRNNWDGLTPVSGDGRHEWNGRLAANLFPVVKNPSQGWFATANEMNIPANYPAEKRKLGFEWVNRSRIEQIESRLRASDKMTLADMMAFQTDTRSPLAHRAVSLLNGLAGDDAAQTGALALLHGWDGDEGVGSAQAALFEIWTSRFLAKATVATIVPIAAQPAFANPDLSSVIAWLSNPGPEFGADPTAIRDRILKTSVADAWREAVRLLGPDPAQWRWGTLHRAQWTHAAAGLADPSLQAQMRVGPLAVGGSEDTPMATSYNPEDFSVNGGASVRMVMDVGAWDNSMVINAPGQSGDPSSPHFRDLFPIWAAGGYVPLLYSREAVLANAEKVFRLQPSPQ